MADRYRTGLQKLEESSLSQEARLSELQDLHAINNILADKIQIKSEQVSRQLERARTISQVYREALQDPASGIRTDITRTPEQSFTNP